MSTQSTPNPDRSSEDDFIHTNGLPRCQWRFLQHLESPAYQCSRVAVLTSTGTIPDREDLSDGLCLEHGETVRESLEHVYLPRQQYSINTESDDESEGTVVLEADDFTERIDTQNDCEICMEPQTHIRQIVNCGHQLCFECLSRVISSENERRNHCPFCRTWMLNTPEPSDDTEK